MTEPKYKIGDIVDVRTVDASHNGVEINEYVYVDHRDEFPCVVLLNGNQAYACEGHWYSHSGNSDPDMLVHESRIYPHNKPADTSLDDIMFFVKNVNTDVDTRALIKQDKV